MLLMKLEKLAERTQRSLTEINTTINIITQSVNEASIQMSKNAKDIGKLSEKSLTAENKINSSTDMLSIVRNETAESAETIKKLTLSTKELVSEINFINDISIENSKSVEDISNASKVLHKSTENLNDKLQNFKS